MEAVGSQTQMISSSWVGDSQKTIANPDLQHVIVISLTSMTSSSSLSNFLAQNPVSAFSYTRTEPRINLVEAYTNKIQQTYVFNFGSA
jgi:hypothetical protein